MFMFGAGLPTPPTHEAINRYRKNRRRREPAAVLLFLAQIFPELTFALDRQD
jgi:hypothetical protein